MGEIAELLERFRRGPEVVAVATTGAAGAQLDFQPEDGKWSVRMILGHLTDAELVAGVRFRRVIAEENPQLLAYDQEAWAANLSYSKRRIADVMDLFRKLRAMNHRLLEELPEEAFSRTGMHSENGVMSLLDLLLGYVEHTERHAEQMHAVRQLYKAIARHGLKSAHCPGGSKPFTLRRTR